jgi:hypothetical protein
MRWGPWFATRTHFAARADKNYPGAGDKKLVNMHVHSRTHTRAPGGGHHFTSSMKPPQHFCGSLVVAFNYMPEVTRYFSAALVEQVLEVESEDENLTFFLFPFSATEKFTKGFSN